MAVEQVFTGGLGKCRAALQIVVWIPRRPVSVSLRLVPHGSGRFCQRFMRKQPSMS